MTRIREFLAVSFAVAVAPATVLVLTLVAIPPAQAQTFSVIHTFSGIEGDHPGEITLIRDTSFGEPKN